jgi:hypothetical protein
MLRTVEKQLSVVAPASDLNRALDRALNAFQRRSLMVVVTDEARPGPEHERLLRRLRVRHEVMVVAVADLSPVGVATVGITAGPAAHRALGAVADVDGTLDLPPFLRGRVDVAEGAAQAVRARRESVVALLRTLQVEAVSVTGTDDVVPRFVELLGRQKRARR